MKFHWEGEKEEMHLCVLGGGWMTLYQKSEMSFYKYVLRKEDKKLSLSSLKFPVSDCLLE